MNLVIFGLALSSSWGNGHATLWRGLVRALARQGHRVRFFEKDVPYYAEHRDGWLLPDGVELICYQTLQSSEGLATKALTWADAAIVTSYCPEGALVCERVLGSAVPVRCFYDLDTPVTLDALASERAVDYLPVRGLGEFDLVLSYTGGAALEALATRLGARRTAPLYGFVDPAAHYPSAPDPAFACELSYLGTYARDRQARLDELFLKPAAVLPRRRFLIGGAMYPADFPWRPNISFARHVAPERHSSFFSSSGLTLNITRAAMAAWGWCPSGRMFEAAACGVPLLSDVWPGLESFFTPGEEILCARSATDVLDALRLSPAELQRMAARARERVLGQHTADHRAAQLELLLSQAPAPLAAKAL